ncbi:MAG: DUF2683 family protein [DPANN group archaeon]|nr:DUF2683 family protein [DPANN group archaeon]
MVQAVINIPERANRVLNVVKAKYGLKDKSQAIALVVNEYEEEFLEAELRPEYVEKLNKIRKEKGIAFRTIDELRKIIEG